MEHENELEQNRKTKIGNRRSKIRVSQQQQTQVQSHKPHRDEEPHLSRLRLPWVSLDHLNQRPTYNLLQPIKHPSLRPFLSRTRADRQNVADQSRQSRASAGAGHCCYQVFADRSRVRNKNTHTYKCGELIFSTEN